MDINEIKLKWKLCHNDKEANIDLWDEKAEYFGNYNIPNFSNDNFLKLIKEENLINKNSRVLDVGCGGGKHTLALSDECSEVYGIDLSPKMIEYAQSNKEKYNKKNITFLCDDWHEIDISMSEMYKKFDLVFASMTPAIQSASTLAKVIDASRKYCILRSSIKRKDSVYDRIREILDIEYEAENLNFLYAFNMLYLQGYIPRISYEEKSWISKEPMKKACDIYIKKIKSIRKINKDEERKIIEFLKGINKEGYIEEEITSTIGTIILDVEK